MHRTYLIILIAALALTGSAVAQDSLRYSTLSVSGGLDALSSKDGLKYPYQYTGTLFLLNSTYTRFQPKGQHIVDLSYSSGHKKGVVDQAEKSRQVFINYDYLFNINTKNKKFIPTVGMGLHTIMDYVDYVPGYESTQTYFSAGTYLTLSGSLSYHLSERSTLRLQVGLPVVGVINRRNGEINGSNYTSLTYFGESILVSAKLEYCYQLTSKLGLIASYRYNYFRYTDPRKLSLVNNGLFFGLRISL